MPPKRTTGASRGNAKGAAIKASKAVEPQSSNPFELSDEEENEDQQLADTTTQRSVQVIGDEEENAEPEKTIPRDLLTRLLHEFFIKDATRVSRDANAATGKYFDVFVREAIARAAVEKEGGFLEVEDLEKVSPQLLLDL